mgnify:CR=1 FL=1
MPEEIKIVFYMYENQRKKEFDIDKNLNEIRAELNLGEHDFFICFEQNQLIEYAKEEEYNTKLKEIVRDKKVYIIRKLFIKQGNMTSAKINLFHKSLNIGLNSESSLQELREKLPFSLKNEKFLKKEKGAQINNDDESDTSINEISDNDIIYMSGKKIVDLKNIGSINIDYAKRVENNMDLITKSDKNIIFFGAVGAGKTTFVRGVIQALIDEEVPSPTFTLLQTYPTPKGDIYHYDFYRLKSPEEALELNIEEAFSSGISFLEWPDKIGRYLPKKHIRITFEVMGAERLVTIEGLS